MVARIEMDDGYVLYDDLADLRGNEEHKNIEKAYGPNAVLTLASGHKWYVRRCPMCQCQKSFDPEVPNKVLYGCDGECPCHDDLPFEERYGQAATG